MIKLLKSRMAGFSALALLVAGIAGCPSAPVLRVSPAALDFGSAAQASVRIQNDGGAPLEWTITEVTRANADAPWVAGDVPWLSAEESSGTVASGMQTVRLNADTSQLSVGTVNNVGIRVDSNGGTDVVPISITVAPSLMVTPTTINLAPGTTTGSFTISNSGTGIANWTVLYLPYAADQASATALPTDINVQPNPGTTGPNQQTTVQVSWAAERTSDFALLVSSTAGNSVVRFKFSSTLEVLTVDPQQLRLFYDPSAGSSGGAQPVSKLRITNSTGTPASWTLEGVTVANPGIAAPITIAPSTGSTGALETTAVDVSVSTEVTPDEVQDGAGNYQLVLRSGESFVVIPVIIELRTLPVIALSEPPDNSQGRPDIVPINLLDLGREEVQGEFWVVNTGPKGSRLEFQVTYGDQTAQNPVIASVEPLEGFADQNGEDFVLPGTNDRVGGVPITVTVDRAAMTQDVEFRTITVVAVDQDGAVLDPVEAQTVQVRIERPPLVIEGATNRSRPPFLMRFVFLLRDNLSKVIRTTEEAVMDRLAFDITEDGHELDLDETNFFVQGPEGLKTNMVLLLDFTGSMYNLGTQDEDNPLAQGEALAQVRAAAESFIRDLPAGYNLQLMYYNDRQQRDRVIHPFSSDRDSLIAALNAFTLPASLFGVSTIRDALIDAIGALEAEDSGAVLPFDEADVRSVVFITDGLDNASEAEESEVIQQADDARARLYPLVYSIGDNSGVGEMLVYAKETGGHAYRAKDVPGLTKLLANESSIELSAGTATENNTAVFRVTNASTASLTFDVDTVEGGFVSDVTPALDSVTAGTTKDVKLTFDPAGLTPGETVVARLNISTIPVTSKGVITVFATPTLVGGNPVILPGDVTFSFRDPLGTVWDELSNQIVLTYITPKQQNFTYNIGASYQITNTLTIRGNFEEDAIAFPGDVLAGQISLVTSGIVQDPAAPVPADRTRAEIFVRADYVPRDVTSFRMRFILSPPADAPAGAAAALAQANTQVELAADGLLVAQDDFDTSWRLLPEGDGIYRVRTENDDDLLYGSFGNLLKITVNNLGPYLATFSGTRQPEFRVEMRVDNDEYFLPAGGGLPSRTKYFLYPGGPTFVQAGPGFPGSALVVGLAQSGIAGPAPTVPLLQFPAVGTTEQPLPIDPEAQFPWDVDGDGIGDFFDPDPLNEAIPSSLIVPDSFEVGPAVNQFNLLVLNNRLDTFTWSVASQPSWVSSVTASNGFAPLAPGQSATLTLTVNRAGLPDSPGIPGTLVLNNSVFGPQEAELTLVNIVAP